MICSKCGIDKPESDFFLRSRKTQRFKRCKRCFMDQQKGYKANLRSKILAKYGNTCRCCGESRLEFLTVDHVNNDGAIHRRSLKSKGGYGFWLWLIKEGLPEGFQTLCWNCNLAKYHYGKCPHDQS